MRGITSMDDSVSFSNKTWKIEQHYWWVKFILHPLSLWLLVIVNFLGSVYGYYWYHRQLAETSWYWWPWIPDSPFSSTLFTLLLLILIFDKYIPALALLANLSAIKYGVWAAIINVGYWRISGNFTFENWMLTVSHLGMAAEGILFLAILSFPRSSVFLVAAWFGLNDGLDYLLNLHPFLFDQSQYRLAWTSVISLSVLLVYTGWLKGKPVRNL